MGDFIAYLCKSDGCPPLFYHPPTWPHDAKVKAKLIASITKRLPGRCNYARFCRSYLDFATKLSR
jgi:hypothetical protein